MFSWLIGCKGGAPTFACKSKGCLWQDWYIFTSNSLSYVSNLMKSQLKLWKSCVWISFNSMSQNSLKCSFLLWNDNYACSPLSHNLISSAFVSSFGFSSDGFSFFFIMTLYLSKFLKGEISDLGYKRIPVLWLDRLLLIKISFTPQIILYCEISRIISAPTYFLFQTFISNFVKSLKHSQLIGITHQNQASGFWFTAPMFCNYMCVYVRACMHVYYDMTYCKQN